MIELKIAPDKCRKCSIAKDEMYICKNGYCSSCNSELSKKYYSRNKNKYKERDKNYYRKNSDKIREKVKEWRNKNPNYQKIRYYNNKEKYKKYNKESRIKRKDKINTYFRERRRNDIQFRISGNLRSRLSDIVKKNKGLKSKKLKDLLGCSIEDFRNHLESKFLPTMTWDNYGSLWHIDHIIPCSKFDLSKKEEQEKCFHYSNLQPLFAVTQIINGMKYIGNINKSDKLEISMEFPSEQKYLELVKRGYNLDYIFILKSIEIGLSLSYINKNEKIAAIIKTMERKGLIDNEKITIQGAQLLEFYKSDEKIEFIKNTVIEIDEFKIWWELFPKRSKFTYKGKSFQGSRILRKDEEACRIKIKAILNKGEVTLPEIIECLKLEIQEKMENSFKTGQNKMDYFNNSVTWLNQRIYENYLEDVRAGKIAKLEEKSSEFYA